MNTHEVEIRIRISPNEKERLLDLLRGEKWRGTRKDQEDIYFCDARYAKESENCPYVIRIRKSDVSELALKSFTGDGHWMELETRIDDPHTLKSILEYIGQVEFLRIVKHRISGKVGDVEINIDSIENLGDFIEFEIITDDADAGMEKLIEYAGKIGLSTDNIITKGYVQLMQESE